MAVADWMKKIGMMAVGEKIAEKAARVAKQEKLVRQVTVCTRVSVGTLEVRDCNLKEVASGL